MTLIGKVALVTGASAGIGRATAIALGKAGADVALNYLGYDDSAEQTAKEIRGLGRKALLVPADVSDQTAVEKVVEQTVAALGRIDVLVTCAVYSDEEMFWNADMAGFRRTIDVTMWGAYYALRAVANQLLKQGQGGSIVIVGSPHAVEAVPKSMAYNMAKAATDQMARSAAVELLPHRIRVNIVHPGWTDTPGERKYFSEEALNSAGDIVPWGRLAKPEEIARGILFLADPESDYITGSTLVIDGGLQLPWWSKRAQGGF
ncbi:MAG: SDR family NAD(P)-dependent oxidoreductase [Gemmataceae bacterium]